MLQDVCLLTMKADACVTDHALNVFFSHPKDLHVALSFMMVFMTFVANFKTYGIL